MASTTATTATGQASSTASGSSTSFQLPSSLKVVGIILAVISGLLIGSSFVFKKKGLLRSQAGHAAGQGVAYLKSPLWWTGMIMMILGEICNFAAYAFVQALIVTPLGALSVVICAITSSIFLKEKLTFFGWLGCALCIPNLTLLPGPQEQTPSQISEFQKMFIAPGFLAYIGVLIAIALSIIIYFGPKYGKQNMLWYITVCSSIGGISVSVTTGLGSAIVTSVMGHNQFNNWFIFFLIGFVVLTEVYYLNVALALFNTVSFCSMVTTIVLFQGLSAPASQILTLVLAFLTICVGITILQMSKVDPTKLTSLGPTPATYSYPGDDGDVEGGEKNSWEVEDPGIEALRGTFGSIMRARSSRMSRSSRTGSTVRTGIRGMGVGGGMVGNMDNLPAPATQHADHTYSGITRHQLYDAPVPSASTQSPRQTTITFGSQDLVHSYAPPGNADSQATHALRSTTIPANLDTKVPGSFLYPPTSTAPSIPPLAPPPRENESVVVSKLANDEPPAPTISTKFTSLPANDPFETPTTPTTPTASAFPSSSDLLANSSYVDVAQSGQEDTKQSRRDRRRDPTRQSRKYPKGADDDDESLRLWEQSPVDEDGGSAAVRLVQSQRPRPGMF
ncbi:magnesium transporter NIPA-domain-containing protein [Melanogaster broomeanus]|nr:magnesium transporter NIPA-domain-containing protein [Melanogaster broomeanus]